MKTRPKKTKPRPHNPDNLTPEQVNPPVKVYRLLDWDEIKGRLGPYDEIEAWEDGEWWIGNLGDVTRFTYRTTLTRAELARLK